MERYQPSPYQKDVIPPFNARTRNSLYLALCGELQKYEQLSIKEKLQVLRLIRHRLEEERFLHDVSKKR